VHFVSDYEHLIYEQHGPVTAITINRPERMNAIGPQTHRELIDAWDRFRADDTALVGVLTGAGDAAFCAGGDLKAAMAGELDVDSSPADGVLGPSRWTDIYKPTIAAVNGVAYAGGLEWACWRPPAPGRADRSMTGCASKRNASTGRSSRPKPSRV
jgi:enoyl-CoA hydratase